MDRIHTTPSFVADSYLGPVPIEFFFRGAPRLRFLSWCLCVSLCVSLSWWAEMAFVMLGIHRRL
eukprot:m.377538 g.377538  ORF g.377538 m.377538 type:complete len:64 (-) comp28206_c0_seq3:793-984(-)